MSTTEMTMSLNDYANEREGVVLFWVGVGRPTGDETPLGYPDLDLADRRGWLELSGTVEEDGTWQWDGEGRPTDDFGNSVTNLRAWVDGERWDEITEEYEAGN